MNVNVNDLESRRASSRLSAGLGRISGGGMKPSLSLTSNDGFTLE